MFSSQQWSLRDLKEDCSELTIALLVLASTKGSSSASIMILVLEEKEMVFCALFPLILNSSTYTRKKSVGLLDPETQKAVPQQRCNNIRFSSIEPLAKYWVKKMPLVSCCVRSSDHTCDPILVYGDTLRALLSSTAVDSRIRNHINGPLEAEIAYFCKDDLVSHLGNLTDKDRLEDLLIVLLDMENLQVELGAREDVRDDPTCLSPITMEYGPDGDGFRDSSDREPLLPRSNTGELSKSAFKLKYGYDSDPFQDPSDTESTSSRSSEGETRQSSDTMDHGADEDPLCDFSDIEIPSPRRQTGEGKKSFRSRFPSISFDTEPHLL